jgi:putative addiction module component (TIGR02574 family)
MDQEQVLALALALPSEQRVALVERLLESLDQPAEADIEAAWSEEIRRRLERLDAGLSKTVPWAEARRRIWAAAGRDVQS